MLPTDRPAETVTGAAGAAFLIAYALGLGDQSTFVIAATAVLAAIPGVVTALVVAYRKFKASGS